MKEYIEREALIRKLTPKAVREDAYGIGITKGLEIAVEAVKRMPYREIPAADVVERKRGEWVINERGFAECTECKFERIGIPLVHRLNFCPNCGCKMVGDADGRD